VILRVLHEAHSTPSNGSKPFSLLINANEAGIKIRATILLSVSHIYKTKIGE
jgi:hypothetical protein